MRNRLLVLLILLLAGPRLRAQGAISVIPGVPVVGAATTFVLSPTYPPTGPVTWDFGDQSQPLAGGTVATHVYARTGSYLVRAVYPYASAQGLPATVQQAIRVAERLGPSAPFTISLLRLRWEDGRTDRSVDQGFAPLVAYADLKYEGTGLLQAQWLVDGIPLGTFTEQLAFAGAATLESRRVLPLPTTDPGEHWVTLRILSPQSLFEPPQIRYYVRPVAAEEPPRVDAVAPSAVRPGEEADLSVRGLLRPSMILSFGKDIAIVAPPRFLSPDEALVRVFVAPTARAGYRPVEAQDARRRSRGPGWIQVLPRSFAPVRAAAMAAGSPWLRPRLPSLLESLAAQFILPPAPGRPWAGPFEGL